MIKEVYKRDGRKIPFNKERITRAIYLAAEEVSKREGTEADYHLSEQLAEEVIVKINQSFFGRIPKKHKKRPALSADLRLAWQRPTFTGGDPQLPSAQDLNFRVRLPANDKPRISSSISLVPSSRTSYVPGVTPSFPRPSCFSFTGLGIFNYSGRLPCLRSCYKNLRSK